MINLTLNSIVSDKRKIRLEKILETPDSFLKEFLLDFLECDYMISYRLYLDDSGTHDGAVLQFLAGTMMSIDEWAKLDPLWCKKLNDYGLKTFHAKDVWGKHPQSAEIFRELGELIFERNSALWWGAVDKEDFQKIKKELPLIKESEFEFLVFGHIGGCPRAMDALGGKGRIGIIIEKGHPPIRPETRKRMEKLEREIGLFEYPWQTSPKGPVPLQVADYMAWNFNRYANTQDDNLPFLKFVNPDTKYRFWGRLFNEEYLRKMFKEYF